MSKQCTPSSLHTTSLALHFHSATALHHHSLIHCQLYSVLVSAHSPVLTSSHYSLLCHYHYQHLITPLLPPTPLSPGIASSSIEGFEGVEPDDLVTLVQVMLQKCLDKEAYCNEFYLQLIKQTTEQPGQRGQNTYKFLHLNWPHSNNSR